jgi:serine/threonine protein kinase
MGTYPTSSRAGGALARLDLDVRRLEEHWRQGREVSLERFWRDCSAPPARRLRDEDAVRLGALIKADLRCRFERGDSATIADYLGDFPELRLFDSRVVSLIYEEYCLREEYGETPDVEGFCGRYPEWRDSLASQLQYHRLLSRAVGHSGPKPSYPKLGGQFEEFRLLALIGKGGSSRVYLASDRSLGEKQVVLKVSLDQGQEPKTQGALDHPHIVPVHSVVFQNDTRLRGLTMPYRPGMPLDEIVRRLTPAGKIRKAATLWHALIQGLAAGDLPLSDQQRQALSQEIPGGDGWKDFPIEGTFSQAAAWVAMILARTLHYSHGMRTFHRDVKPGNVLLTLQHGPQLLDFNLAESPHAARQAESAMLGGTLPYMAPEQIEAFLNPNLWGRVDARSDIYSLGLVLRELITAEAPDLPDDKLPPPRAMRELLDRRVCLVTDIGRLNPDVPFALRAIVDRCLKFHPDERYPNAQALAEDLERFLHREPLAHAINPSHRERTANWVIRNRREVASRAAILVLSCALLFPWLASYLRPDPSNLPVMEQAAAALNSGRAHEAIEPLRKLVLEYPDHPLPRAVKGVAEALSKQLVANDAQIDVAEALNLPGAEGALLDWGRNHPEFPDQIERYVDYQIQALNDLKRKQSEPVKETGRTQLPGPLVREQDEQTNRKHHETWLKLVNLGLKLAPDSIALREKRLVIDEYFGRYELVYGLFNQLLEPTSAATSRPAGVVRLDLLTRRDRVAVKWARSLLGERNAGDAQVRHARELIEQAVADLSARELIASSITSELAVKPDRGTAQFVYNHLWVGVETWLSLGQCHEHEGRMPEADLAYRKAERDLRRLVSCGEAYLIARPPTFPDLERRVLSQRKTRLAAGR